MTHRPISRPPPSTGGRLAYAVGDVHGYADALKRLLEKVAADAAQQGAGERPLLIFVGDYVDRGPDSRGVIDLVLQAETRGVFEVVALKGNHEEALQRFLEEPAYAPAWIGSWGAETLASYGIAPPSPENPAACATAQAQLARSFPSAHRAFLARLPLSHVVGDYLFVHAGVRPGVALDAQAERDLIWIRREFLESDDEFGKVVVHGHTPSLSGPELKANRINVDTGVYLTGQLTAVRLQADTSRFLQVTV